MMLATTKVSARPEPAASSLTDTFAEATQTADKTEDASEFDDEHAYLSSAIDADQARAADASKSEPAPPSSSTAAVAEKEQQEPPTKDEKKSGGGGFLKAIGLGGGKKKEKEDEKEAQAQAGAAAEKAEAEKHLPPNHLGSAVPEGASKDLADPGTVAPGQTDGLAAQQGTTTTAVPQVSEPASETTETPRSPSTSAAGKQPDRGSSVGSSGGLSPDRSRSTGGGALAGSRGEGRGSMVPADAPKFKRVENPDRIPTAGGKRIGEEQYQTRRASMAPPASPPRDMAKLDREGSPDPVTEENTVTNTAPSPPAAAATKPHVEGKNTAPQQMKDFKLDDAIKDAESKPTNIKESAATEDVAPDEGPKGAPATNHTASPSTGGAVGAAKDKLSPSSGKENSSAGGHVRRGSVFDKLKDKFKGGKSSSKSP